jgi:predicted lysophospholipase L1 biosynthesis ABC-type transport system permease subunit
VAYPEAAAYRGVHFMNIYWRLKPAVSLAQAQAEMAQIDERIAQLYPDNEYGRRTLLLPLHQSLVGNIRPALLMLFGAVGLVLLIACANFAMLLMARAVSRRRELMTRAALGAKTGRLVRQCLSESSVLALIGGATGLLLAWSSTQVLVVLKPAALKQFGPIHMDGRVFLFAFAISLLTGIIFGLAPAWSATRANLAESLKEGTRAAGSGPSHKSLHNVLVASEFALALVLLVGAGLLIKAFLRPLSAGSCWRGSMLCPACKLP